MKTYSPAYLAHVRGPVTSIARCWRVFRNDGLIIRGTDLDRDISIASGPRAGVYLKSAAISAADVQSTSDMSVPNSEVAGAFPQGPQITDLTPEAIQSGLFENAPIEFFEVNWKNPNDFQDVRIRGYLGQVKWVSEGQYTAELRGLAQAIQQALGRTFSSDCDVKRFGDSRCKKDAEALRYTGVVTAVTTRHAFTASLALPGGSQNANVRVWDEFPEDIEVGDTFSAVPGCDKRLETCLHYENVVNFRGSGYWAPGIPSILRATGGAEQEPNPSEDGDSPTAQELADATLAYGEMTFTSGANDEWTRQLQLVSFV